jgi:hypothetical protein
MPFVIFVAPFFNETAVRYIDAALSLPDVRLAVISQDPQAALPHHLSSRLAGHWRVDLVLDASQVAHAAYELSQRHGPIHRLFSGLEHVQAAVAQVREWLGIAGMSVEGALNFRDKARMKALLRAAGLPTAHFRSVTAEDDAWQFAAQVGFPLVVKPQSGAGSLSTFRVDSPEALGAALATARPRQEEPMLIEEFITGTEHSFDTFSLRGVAVWHSLTHYDPSPLEVLSNPWIQWTVLLPREVDDARYDDIRQAAFRALDVLGMGTGMSHLEWFRRRDGSIAISEVAARPPGAQFTRLISYAHDFDCVRAWVRLVVHGEFEPPERRYAAGIAYPRGQGRGRVVALHGLDAIQRELGPLIVEARLPERGQAPATGYEGDGYIILRHPDTEVVRQALSRVVSLVRVELGEL